MSAPDFWVDGHFIGGARDADEGSGVLVAEEVLEERVVAKR